MLEIKDLTVRFKVKGGTITAIEKVNLNVHDNEKLCVIGESGSGKSILMLAVLGLLPGNAIVTGQILLDGEDLLKKTKKEMTKILGVRISYVPQGSGNSLNPLIKLSDQVSEACEVHQGISKDEGKKLTVRLFKRFSLGDEEKLCDSYPHTLSGGMRQRVLLSLGVAPDAPLLVADEPTKGLDRDRVGLVTDCFKNLEGTTLLCVTHDLGFARSVADRIAIIYAGQMIEVDTTDHFFKGARHPYSRALIEAMPQNGLKAIPGFSPGHDDYTDGCRFYDRCSIRTDRCKKDPPVKYENETQVKCLYAID